MMEGKKKLIQELQVLPEVISRKELAVMELLESVEESKQDCTILENMKMMEIVSEKLTEEGKIKLKFPNPEARAAELSRLLVTDITYLDKQSKLKDYQLALNNRKVELNFLLNKQSNLRAITRLYGNEE